MKSLPQHAGVCALTCWETYSRIVMWGALCEPRPTDGNASTRQSTFKTSMLQHYLSASGSSYIHVRCPISTQVMLKHACVKYAWCVGKLCLRTKLPLSYYTGFYMLIARNNFPANQVQDVRCIHIFACSFSPSSSKAPLPESCQLWQHHW